MNSVESKLMLFRTPAQWAGGLTVGVEPLREGGLTLFSRHSFADWMLRGDKGIAALQSSPAVFVDDCQQIYFVSHNDYRFYKYDAVSNILEEIDTVGGKGSDPGEFKAPGRMLAGRDIIWILDLRNCRVQGICRRYHRVIALIDWLERPMDIALDRDDNLLVLDKATRRVHRHGSKGRYEMTFGRTLKKPFSLSIGREHYLYVLDREYRGFMVFDENGEPEGRVGSTFQFPKEHRPRLLSIDRRGRLFVTTRAENITHLYEFDSGGNPLGEVKLPDDVDTITGVAWDSQGDLFLSGGRGIIWLQSGKNLAGKPGFYYSPTLDNGSEMHGWHRVDFDADIPQRTALNISYYSSSDTVLRNEIDAILNGSDSYDAKASALNDKIGSRWTVHEQVKGGIFFQEETGRFLWLKLELTTFDSKVRPVISEMRVHYPRISYLRYLPAFYKEDPVGRDFLDRFLSIFESSFYTIESEVATIFKHFDPEISPPEFLNWLGSWLNLAVQEDWREDLKRTLIARAFDLYKKRGTATGLSDLLEIIFGVRPLIVEHARIALPFLVKEQGTVRLGVDSYVLAAPIRELSLGHSGIIGRAALLKGVADAGAFLQAAAYRFTVLLPLDSQTFRDRETEIRRIVEAAKPAHTDYLLQTIGENTSLGGCYIGVNTRLSNLPPFALHHNLRVGGSVLINRRKIC